MVRIDGMNARGSWVLRDLLDDGRARAGPGRPPPKGSDAMRAKLTDDRFSDPDVDLRAQARRHPLRRGPRRRRGAAVVAQRPLARRPLPRDRRGARRPRRRRASRSTARSSPSTAGRRASRGWPSAGSARRRSSSTCSTCSGSTAATCARCRCARASGCCASALRFERHVRLTPHRNARRRGVLRRGLPARLGGPDRQARRQHLLVARARATG